MGINSLQVNLSLLHYTFQWHLRVIFYLCQQANHRAHWDEVFLDGHPSFPENLLISKLLSP